MFKIDELLDLFQDEKIRKMLAYSYCLSQEKDKELSDSVFKQFLLLKKMNPNINVILDLTKEKSCFRCNENTIYMNNLSAVTFFHELTHLLSYNYSMFQIPYEYYFLKENFLADPSNKSNIMLILDLCKSKREELVQSLKNRILDRYKNITINEMDIFYQEPYDYQYDLIGNIEDIIDALYDGRSHSYGLVNITDINEIAIKAQKTSGHGCEYFSEKSFQFEEILAEYQTIKLIDPKNEIFFLLKKLLGTEFISFLEHRSNEICGKTPKIEFNNNISKKK